MTATSTIKPPAFQASAAFSDPFSLWAVSLGAGGSEEGVVPSAVGRAMDMVEVIASEG